MFALLRVALTALTTHGGPDVLFTLPSVGMPDWLGGFTVGSTIEGPILAQAAYEGFVIVGVIAVFAAFNAVASHHELVQSLPRVFTSSVSSSPSAWRSFPPRSPRSKTCAKPTRPEPAAARSGAAA